MQKSKRSQKSQKSSTSQNNVSQPNVSQNKSSVMESQLESERMLLTEVGNKEFETHQSQHMDLNQEEQQQEIEQETGLIMSSLAENRSEPSLDKRALLLKTYLNDTGLSKAFTIIFAEILQKGIEIDSIYKYAA